MNESGLTSPDTPVVMYTQNALLHSGEVIIINHLILKDLNGVDVIKIIFILFQK